MQQQASVAVEESLIDLLRIAVPCGLVWECAKRLCRWPFRRLTEAINRLSLKQTTNTTTRQPQEKKKRPVVLRLAWLRKLA